MRKWRKTSSFKTHRVINVVRVMAKVAKKRVARAHEVISGGEIRAKAGQVVAVRPVAMVRPAALAAMLSWRPRSPLSNHCLRSIPLW